MAFQPYICQSAFAQTTASVTLSLPLAPTVGNTLCLIASGFAGSFTIPSGFSQVVSNTGTYNQTWLFTKLVTSADASNYSYTLSGMSDIHMFALLEVSGQPIITSSFGTSSGSNPLTTASLAAKGRYDTMRLLVYEWDQRGPMPSTAPNNYTQVSPTSFVDPGVYSYHASVIYQIPSTASGVQNLPMSGSCNYPVWMDLSFTAPGPQVIQNDVKTVQDPSIPMTFTLQNNVTPGNFLLMAVYGPDTNYRAPPGFSVPISGGSSGNTVSYCYKTATASDGNSFSIGCNSGVYDFQLLEISGGAPPASVAKGTCTISGSRITAGSTVISGDASSLLILLFGWRERDLLPTTPKAFFDAEYGRDYFTSSHWAPNNSCNMYFTPPIWNGQAQSLVLSGTPSAASYIALQITSKTAKSNRASVIWMF